MTEEKKPPEETRNGKLRIPLPVDEALRAAMKVPPEKARHDRPKEGKNTPRKGEGGGIQPPPPS